MRTAAAAIALALLAAPACGGPPHRDEPPTLRGDESQAEVRERLGPPDRALTVADPSGGPERAVWLYDGPADRMSGGRVAGPKIVTRLVFEGGRLVSVEEIEVASDPPGALYPGAPGLPRDSTSHRGE